ncbi:MAG: flagellar motor switch protein FliM, partial [Sphingobium sp.]|nr:flagellar motor switch protein FliM [Sphingobium sp.]
MVNEGSDLDVAVDRRAKERAGPLIARTAVLGQQNLNPFGDLHTLQHLSALFARSMRGVFEPLLRRELRVWAEPLVVQRFADYRAERPETLTAWLPLIMAPLPGRALMVADGKFVLELLDLFFGGHGEAPHHVPNEFSPAAEAMIVRLGGLLAGPLRAAWEPLAKIEFAPGHPESNPALLVSFDADDAMIVTRFGISASGGKPTFLDVLYPVAALKPH